MAEFGDLLSALGEFGRFQKLLMLLLSLPLLLNPFQMIAQVFMVVEVPHHCDTSWVRTVGPNLTEEEQLNLTLPRGADGEFEQCSMYSPVDWDLDSIMAYGLNDTQKCSSGWVYPSEQPPSLLTEVGNHRLMRRGRGKEGMGISWPVVWSVNASCSAVRLKFTAGFCLHHTDGSCNPWEVAAGRP